MSTNDDVNTQAKDALAERLLGEACVARAEHNEALQHYNRALALLDVVTNKKDVADLHTEIGNVLRTIGSYSEALARFEHALLLYTDINELARIASVRNNIGIIFDLTGLYPEALEHFQRALLIDEEQDNHEGIARTLGNIGIMYALTESFPEAQLSFERALAYYEDLGETQGVAINYSNLGGVHAALGNFDEAMNCFTRSMHGFEVIGDAMAISALQSNIAELLVRQERFDEAELLLHDQSAKLLDDPGTKSNYHELLAAIRQHQGAQDEALEHYNIALEKAQDAGLQAHAARIHKAMRNLAQQRNDFAAYIEHNNEYQRITNEINGKETATKLATIEAERKMAAERQERQREQAILYSTLPKHIADRVIRGEVVNDHIDNAAVMFLDIVGFTTLSSTLTSEHVIKLLDAVFKICDEACNANNVTRIKTIGDSYMAVAFPSLVPRDDNPLDPSSSSESLQIASSVANAALQIIEHVKQIDFKSLLSLQVPSTSSSPFDLSQSLQIRIGVHVGPITAGVLGTERLQYDVWGDTVNVASRLESTSEPNRIQVSEVFARSLAHARDNIHSPSVRDGVDVIPSETRNEHNLEPGTWNLEPRGQVEIKGKGTLTTYWLE